jgi:hypothetical protein
LLDSYNEERGKVGEELLRGTARGLRLATASNVLLGRTRDFVIQRATEFQMIQTAMVCTMAEVSISYRGSSIVRTQGVNGTLRAGDRTPDAVCKETGNTLLAALREAKHLLITLDHSLGARPGIYLVRPHGYIGSTGKSTETLRKHAHEVGLL